MTKIVTATSYFDILNSHKLKKNENEWTLLVFTSLSMDWVEIVNKILLVL